MTDEQYKAFCGDIDALCAKHYAWMEGDYMLDRVMLALAACMRREQVFINDDLVNSCLESCAVHLGHAALDYYASMK